jgi:hypothetical protein
MRQKSIHAIEKTGWQPGVVGRFAKALFPIRVTHERAFLE